MSRIRHLTLLGLAVCLLALPASALARPPGPDGRDPGRFVGRLLDRIDADEETRAAIEVIVEESRAEGERLRDEVKAARGKLHELMQVESPDHDAVFEQAEALGRVETEARIHRLDVMLRVQEELTPEQREQIRGMRHARHARILDRCAEDLTALCPDVDPDRTRDSVRCLMRNRAQLSDGCQEALPTWGGKRAKHGKHHACAAAGDGGACSCSCGDPGGCRHGDHAAAPADEPDGAPADAGTTPAD